YTVAFDEGQQRFVARAIDFGDSGDRLFLVLYGTGFRNAAAPTRAVLRAGSVTLPISYLAAQPETPGLDQLNAELPRSLAGAGSLAVTFQVNGRTANPVTLLLR